MTYVAFTRPVRELHVHYDPSAGVGRLLPDALRAAHPSDAAPEGLPLAQGAADGCEGCYTYGTPTAPAAQKPESSRGDTMSAPPYRVCLRDDTRELTCVADITNSPDDGELEIGNEADTRQPLPAIARSDEDSARIRAAGRGNDLHNILARMRTLDDLDHALAKVCDAAGAGDSVRPTAPCSPKPSGRAANRPRHGSPPDCACSPNAPSTWAATTAASAPTASYSVPTAAPTS